MKEPATLEEMLGELEAAIARLADGTAPLDELVEAYRHSTDLLGRAEVRLQELRVRAEALESSPAS